MATVGKPVTCRAAVAWEIAQPLCIETVQVAVPKAGEVRVKMSAAGICYSDLSLGKGLFPQLKFPTVLGHEGVGIIESVGSGVSSLKPGDTIIPLWNIRCGKCRWCQRARRNHCQATHLMMQGTLLDKTTRITCKGKDISQAMGTGLFSEYVVISELQAAKVKPCPSLENLAAFGCCVPTGYGAAEHTSKVDENSVVAIWGLGAIGLCVALGCRDAKSAKIIGIDTNPDKFEIGKKFGCTDLLNPKDFDKPMSQVLKEMTNGLGVDFAFVCVGNVDVMDDAVEACSPGGSECVIIGLGTFGAKIKVNHSDIIGGKLVKGSWCGDCTGLKHIPELVDKYSKGNFPTDQLVTEVITLEKINEGFELLKNGKAIRTVIKF